MKNTSFSVAPPCPTQCMITAMRNATKPARANMTTSDEYGITRETFDIIAALRLT